MIVRILTTIILGFIVFITSATGAFYNPQHNVFILEGSVGQSGENYYRLYQALANAEVGDKIYIILVNNGGGWAADGYAIRDSILHSDATVITEARGDVSSTALTILLSGDYIRIPKDKSVHVAHMQFIGSMTNPIRLGFMKEKDRREYPAIYKKFLFPKEWDIIMSGGNAWVTGAGICHNAPHKTKDNARFCEIDNHR